MAIKRREKPLTPEEAIALAKKQLAPYWFGCPEPLLAAVRDEGGVRAYPLDFRMTDRAWLIFFVDPFMLSARDALLYAKSWARRYEPQKLNVMVILKLAFPFAQESTWGRKIAHQIDGPVVTVMDRDDLLFQAFQVKDLPRVVLFHQNKQVIDRSGTNWLKGAELEIQKVLRQSDPGLSLFEPITEPAEPACDKTAFNLTGSKSDVVVSFQGKWARDNDRMIAQDAQASLSFKCGGKRLAIIAQTLAERGESEMIVEVQKEYPRDAAVLDEDLKIDFQVLSNPLADPSQKRRATAHIGAPRLYHLFRALPATHREVTLRFPGAEKSPVAIYGLRMGD